MTTTVIHRQQVQQSNVQIYPQYVQQGCIPLAGVPVRLRQPVYGMAITMLVLGATCIVIGGICVAVFIRIPIYYGVNIWVGLMYLITGALGTAHYQKHNQQNVSLMHGFYAFCIISIIFAVPHFGIAIGGIATRLAVVSGSISIVFSVLGLCLSIALTVILSKYLYCGQTAYFNYNHRTVVTVAQPAPMVMYQPNMATQQPVYTVNQQIAQGQQMAYSPVGAMPSTAITNPQPVATINEKGSEAPHTYNP